VLTPDELEWAGIIRRELLELGWGTAADLEAERRVLEFRSRADRDFYEMLARNLRLTVSGLVEAVVDAEDARAQREAVEDLRRTLGSMCRQLSGPMGAPLEGTRRRTVMDGIEADRPWLQPKRAGAYTLLEGA